MPETATTTAPAPAPASAAPSAPQTLVPGFSNQSTTAPASSPPASQSWSWAGEDGKLSDGWIDKLPDGLKNEASLKAIDSLPNLAKSYVETKKLIGKKLEMPAPDSDPAAIAAWRKTVGAPESPEGYLGDAKSLRPANLPEQMWNADTEKGFLNVAHKHSLPPAAVKDILDFYGQSIGNELQSVQAKEGEFLKAEGEKLRQAWGGEHDANLVLAGRMAQTVGLDPQAHPIFQNAEVVQAFAKMGKLLSEDKLVKGTHTGINGAISERIKDITDPTSSSDLARAYRGEFEQSRPGAQAAAQKQLHDLWEAQSKQT